MARRNPTHAQPVYTCEPPTCPENPTSHSLRQFFAAYRKAVAQNHWNANQALVALPSYIPIALNELITLADPADVDSVGGCEDVLLEALFPGDSTDQSQRDLFSARQLSSETVLTYFGRVMQMGRVAFAALDEDVRNQMLANFFVSTLKPEFCSILSTKQPTSPEQALAMARAAEATVMAKKGPTGQPPKPPARFCQVHGQGTHSSDRCFVLHPHLRPKGEHDKSVGRPPPTSSGRRNRLNQLDCASLENDCPTSDVPPLDWDPQRHE